MTVTTHVINRLNGSSELELELDQNALGEVVEASVRIAADDRRAIEQGRSFARARKSGWSAIRKESVDVHQIRRLM